MISQHIPTAVRTNAVAFTFHLTGFTMKTIKKVSLCVLASIIAFFSSLNAQNVNDAYRTETFQVDDNPAVMIRTSGGSIEAEGHSENEVRVYMIVKRGSNVLSPGEADLDDFDIDIRKTGNRVIASAEKRSSGWFGSGSSNISISFIVQAPETASVEGNTSGGSVSAFNFTSPLKLSTSGGTVTAESIRSDTELRTSGGSIRLSDISGSISARTSGGSITAEDIHGASELQTSGGSIRLSNSSGPISARTSGGSIRAELTEFNDDLDLRTSGGSISIRIPRKDHFTVDLAGSRVDIELRNFSGRSDRRSIEGEFGNGGPVLAARTSAGTVRVEYY